MASNNRKFTLIARSYKSNLMPTMDNHLYGTFSNHNIHSSHIFSWLGDYLLKAKQTKAQRENIIQKKPSCRTKAESETERTLKETNK